ncbi:MAG: Holliday junction branch migration protein RuvA [Betaproteobacteria bacterium TMED41]|nr:MAG: Holliday junction branch migration protein RuvA [Betaproteobacteria bacterium TMED41]
MIAQITGTLIQKKPQFVIIDVQGVGYEIEIPMSTFYNLPEIGSVVKIITHHLVREDAQQLFGFLSLQEKATFKILIKINGIGPKVALAILSGMSVYELAQNIENNEIHNIVRIPGIGKKTAERMVIELRGKIEILAENKNKDSTNKIDLIKALLSLGYTENEAKLAIKTITLSSSIEENIKTALKSLS